MSNATLAVDASTGGGITVSLAGNWLLGGNLPGPDPVLDRLRQQPRPAGVDFDTRGLEDWDTGLITTVINIARSAEANGVAIDQAGLPEGARKLIELAFAVKEREGARRAAAQTSCLADVGVASRDIWHMCVDMVEFSGEVVLSVGRYLRGKAKYLGSDFVEYVQQAGAQALPIVSLVSFLIGMIFAFVGVMQLRNFGAGISTADLVAVAMIREMAPIMTAIIMAGRTGAAYAAQLGTMKVNEEIDALTTLGLDPTDFLVLPRLIALIIMMPLLTMYSSLMGILGGTLVAMFMLDASFIQYAVQTVDSVGLNALFGGLFKSVVYGSLVAVAGCQQGMACGNSAMAVGQATTRAVVMSIVLIVVAASILTVIYINLGI
ncbi:MAG: ABC transporter permease [Gammaproteobacteria bacterium]|nr:ABC transporter permease [Gammaproteobacteria bacterium]